MDALTLKVNLDCLRKDSQAIINAKVGEANGRKVVFTLYEGRTAFFVPAGASVIFRAQKPDGTILYNNCVIDDGKVEYTITSQTVAVAGVYACELQIVSDGRIIYSPYVTLNVMDNLYADTEVESSNEFTELENALNRIPSLEVINSKYTKPNGGIPKADLANDVQASLNKADTALQEHQSLAAYRTAEAQDLIDSTKQDKLIAGENITIAADGKTISATGGGSSVPKPLTYDYMPEGYPTKSVQATTLMEEQTVEFFEDDNSVYLAETPILPEIVAGETYTVNWDGTEYKRVCVVSGPIPALGNLSFPVLGNLSIYGWGDDTSEPFFYGYNTNAAGGSFATLDTSPTHTISIKTTDETIIPMAEEFIPHMNVSAFTNDAGYLTLATLPKYGGESV